MTLNAVDKNGNIVSRRSIVTDFRGVSWEFGYATRARAPGKDGKVMVSNGSFGWQEFYADVFGLTVEEL